MTEALSLAGASAAMAEALANTESATPVEVTPIVTPEATPATNVAETPGEAPVVDYNFDGIDFTKPLTPEEVQKVKDGALRQQDYTKKTQEVAPYRKFIDEAGGDLDHVRKSVEFVNRLENDPVFLRQVAQELADLAKDENTNVTEQPPVATENTGTDPALINTVAELAQWRAEMAAEKENAVIVAQWEEKIQNAENAVKASNPTYTDDDITQIYKLMPANEHDFFKSQEQYEALRNMFVNGAIKGKLNHPSAANPVNSGTGATQAGKYNTIEEAAAATRERMRQTA